MIISGGALFLALLLAFTAYAVYPLRQPIVPRSSTKILDRQGNLLYEVTAYNEGRQTLVPYNQLPKSFVQALVASEDARFFDHHGVDLFASARAIKDLLREQKVVSGASTLEQQVVKNLYFPHEERTVLQKLREMVAGFYWSSTHSKEQTLETYANILFLGNRSIGVQAAAEGYFHKSVQDLTLAESAFLVGIIPAPSEHDPYHHWKVAKARQREVLDQMLKKQVITTSEHDEAVTAAMDIFTQRHEINAPHFVFQVLDELETRYPDIQQGGYLVRTTLDPDMQRQATEAVQRRISQLADQHVTNGALMAMSPQTGQVLAYVGSRDYFDASIQGQVDMVRARRQPGSALKPFLYFQALQQGFTPATVLADIPVRFETAEGASYYPRNYGYAYHGPVTLRDALGSSLNIPAVRVLSALGLESFVGTLRSFGIQFPESPTHYGLGLVLGGGETNLAAVTHAYASLALYARSVTPVDILEVRDAKDIVREQYTPSRHVPLFPSAPLAESSAWLVSDMLSDKQARNISFGESNLLDFGKRIAVKTGTTKDFRDNWAFGYTPDLVVGVWVGNADNSAMQGVSGVTGAVPIMHEVMQTRYKNQQEISWPSVTGIVSRQICLPSGKLATAICPKSRKEVFLEGTEPTELDDWYTQTEVSPGLRKIFLHPPPEYDAWIRVSGWEQSPGIEGGSQSSTPAPRKILSPLEGDQFQGDDLNGNETNRIPFIASGSNGQINHWKLNGQPIESSQSTYFWSPRPGRYTLELEGASTPIHFSVQ